jgi:DNA-binding LytR/AlgR family response regulator
VGGGRAAENAMAVEEGGIRVRAVICEDEPLAVRALRQYLKDVDWVEVVGEARNGRDALRLIHKEEPELVFLDVRMPGLTGLEVLEALTHHPAVAFTTAFDEYAVQAFEFGAVDYLVKPFGRDRLVETLDRVRVRLVGEGVVGRGRTGRPARLSAFPPACSPSIAAPWCRWPPPTSCASTRPPAGSPW